MTIDKESLHSDYKKAIYHYLNQLGKSITDEQIEDVYSQSALNDLIKDVNSGAN